MSHTSEIDPASAIPAECLGFLFAAVKQFCPTLEVVEQNTYRTWKSDHGSLVGDYPVPVGWTEAQIGEGARFVIRCTDEHLKTKQISNRHANGAPYEIGVVPVSLVYDETGKVKGTKYDPAGTHYTLMLDWYNQGYGLLQQPGLGDRKDYKRPDGTVVKTCLAELLINYRTLQQLAVQQKIGDKLANIVNCPDGSRVLYFDTKQRVGT